MKIGIQNIDRTSFPNLALRKIENYHRRRGDEIFHEPVMFDGKLDILYASKIFNFSKDSDLYVHADIINRGGTGYDIDSKLPPEIESELPFVGDLSFGFEFERIIEL